MPYKGHHFAICRDREGHFWDTLYLFDSINLRMQIPEKCTILYYNTNNILYLQSVLQQANSFLPPDKNGSSITEQEITKEIFLLLASHAIHSFTLKVFDKIDWH